MYIDEVAELDLCYALPFASVWDPMLQVANKARFVKGWRVRQLSGIIGSGGIRFRIGDCYGLRLTTDYRLTR